MSDHGSLGVTYSCYKACSAALQHQVMNYLRPRDWHPGNAPFLWRGRLRCDAENVYWTWMLVQATLVRGEYLLLRALMRNSVLYFCLIHLCYNIHVVCCYILPIIRCNGWILCYSNLYRSISVHYWQHCLFTLFSCAACAAVQSCVQCARYIVWMYYIVCVRWWYCGNYCYGTAVYARACYVRWILSPGNMVRVLQYIIQWWGITSSALAGATCIDVWPSVDVCCSIFHLLDVRATVSTGIGSVVLVHM